jgi:uncharacterized protein YggE
MRTPPFRWTAAALVAAALGCAGVAYSQTAQAPVPAPAAPGGTARGRTIVVAGEGSVDATPDRATVSLSVVVQRPTAREAQQQNAATMAQVMRQVAAAGIPPSAIRTTAVSLFPQHRPQPGGGEGPITGYEAVNRIVVTVDDISRIGQVIDAAVGGGANGVDGLEWSLRDAAAARAQALRIAVQNAQATANAIAAAAGVGGLRLVRIDEVTAVPGPRPGVAMAAAAPSTPVVPGTMPVRAGVRVVYAF